MIDIALKEWSIVCDLLCEGRYALLLRKGGIHEDEGAGVFRLEHRRFALFPSWAHQQPEMIKPPHRDRVQVMHEPDQISLRAIADAQHIWQVPGRAAFDTLDDLHPWTKPQIDMRFDYKPERPLYLVALRVHLLTEPHTIENDQTYGGCRSWVPLKDADVFEPQVGAPAMDNATFETIITRVNETMKTQA